MLNVEGLVKQYGDFVAVDDASFTAGAGACLVFLARTVLESRLPSTAFPV